MPGRCAVLLLAAPLARGSTLRDAVDANDPAAVSAALTAGADMNEIGADGQTAFTYSTMTRKFKAVKTLLLAGADANIGNRDTGMTAMHLAAVAGDASLVKWLIKKGVDKSPVDTHGLTPLHRACQGGEPKHTDSVWAFLDAGVVPDETSADGMTPIDIAKTNDNTRKLLQEAVAEKERNQRKARQSMYY